MVKEITTIQQAYDRCQVSGNAIRVPVDAIKTLDIRNEAFDMLADLGGAWQGSGTGVFNFKEDPTPKLQQLIGTDVLAHSTLNCATCDDMLSVGELRGLLVYPYQERMCGKCQAEMSAGASKATKKSVSVESITELIGSRMISIAKIQATDMVCDPSAGTGALVKMILKACPGVTVHVYELLPAAQKILKKISGANFIRPDFLHPNFPWERFDKIVAYPPMKDNAYTYHIREMHARLQVGGTLVSLAAKSYQNSKDFVHKSFSGWLDQVGADVIDVSPEDLSEAGITTPFVIITIKK